MRRSKIWKKREAHQNQEKQHTPKPPVEGCQSAPPRAANLNSFQVLDCASLIDSEDEEAPAMAPNLEVSKDSTDSLLKTLDSSLSVGFGSAVDTHIPPQSSPQHTSSDISGIMATSTMMVRDTANVETEVLISEKEFPTPAETKKRNTKKHKWGPVDRLKQDGRSILSRAQDIISQKNLEKPTNKDKFKHSFATICNSTLASTAKDINVCLGPTPVAIHRQIDHLKLIEQHRLQNLANDEPKIFLPTEIDITLDDILEHQVSNCNEPQFNYDSPPSEYEHEHEQDDGVHVSYKLRKDRSYKSKKPHNNFDVAVSYLEC